MISYSKYAHRIEFLRNILHSCLIAFLLIMLCGCNKVSEQAVPIKDTCGYTLEISEAWGDNIKTSVDGGKTEIWIDGGKTATFVSVKNQEGAKEEAKQLIQSGYSYYCSNYDYYFYRQVFSADNTLDETELEACFRYIEDNAVGTAFRYDTDRDRITVQESLYENYRLGFSFEVPEAWRGRMLVEETEGIVYILVADGDEDVFVASVGMEAASYAEGKGLLHLKNDQLTDDGYGLYLFNAAEDASCFPAGLGALEKVDIWKLIESVRVLP